MKKIIFITAICIPYLLTAQTNFYSTAYPSLQIPGDTRTASLANAGTALDCDLSAINTNPARLAMMNVQHSVGFDFTMLPTIAKDAKKVSLKYAFLKGERSCLGVGINYYSGGLINLRDDVGGDITTIKSAEYNISLSYAMQITDNSHLGLTFRFLNQNKLYDAFGSNTTTGTSAVGVDLGFLHNFEFLDDSKRLRLGVAIQNIGSKLNGSIYQPMNLSLGLSYSNGYYDNDEKYKSGIAFLGGIQIDKPLVPTPPIYDENGKILKGKDYNRSIVNNLFSTWNDAPDGFKENIKQIRYSIYSEAVLQQLVSLRAGYTHENSKYGGRTFVSLGTGIKWSYQESAYQVNLAYILPQGTNASVSPLKNSLSLQFMFQFGRK